MFDRVMLIDDNDADLVYNEVMLCGHGVAREVQGFDTARAALRCLADPAQPPFSLILLDINMPEMDGFGFLDAWAPLRLGHARPPAVVMLTSSPEPADRERALAVAGVQDYLVKPLDDAMLRRLQALMPLQPGQAGG